MTNDKFKFEITVCIGDTNMEGNVYWTKYYEWMGKAREMLLIQAIPNIMEMFNSGLRLITYQSSIKHIKSVFFTQHLEVNILVSDIQNAKMTLTFNFIEGLTSNLVATGWQTYVFSDSNGKIIKVPEYFVKRFIELT